MSKNIEYTKADNHTLKLSDYKYLIFMIIAPFIAGEIFFFAYVAGGNFGLFKAIFADPNKLYAAWIIGYEMLAVVLVAKILLSMKSVSLKNPHELN